MLPAVFGDNNTSDCNGHGTHTAATVGGLSYGVAKNVTLWPVRAMNCQGGSTVSYLLKVCKSCLRLGTLGCLLEVMADLFHMRWKDQCRSGAYIM